MLTIIKITIKIIEQRKDKFKYFVNIKNLKSLIVIGEVSCI